MNMKTKQWRNFLFVFCLTSFFLMNGVILEAVERANEREQRELVGQITSVERSKIILNKNMEILIRDNTVIETMDGNRAFFTPESALLLGIVKITIQRVGGIIYAIKILEVSGA